MILRSSSLLPAEQSDDHHDRRSPPANHATLCAPERSHSFEVITSTPALFGALVTSGRRFLAFLVLLGVSYPRWLDGIPYPLTLDLQGHLGVVTDLVLAHTHPSRIISAGLDKTIRVWNLGSGDLLDTWRGYAGTGSTGTIRTLALSPDGRWLAAAGSLGEPEKREEIGAIRFYDVQTSTLLGCLRAHRDEVIDLAMADVGGKRFLASASRDDTIRLWDLSDPAGPLLPASIPPSRS